MKPAAPGMRAQWRVVSIADKDPNSFAGHLEATLQDLSDTGWQLMSQTYRGEALILTACRMAAVEPPVVQPPTQRRTVTHETKGDAYNEVLYSYVPGPGVPAVTEKFESLMGALILLEEHMQRDWPLPIKIVKCALTIYEAKAIPALLRLYAKDLQTHGRTSTS